jgi:hypothetical protein
VCPIAFRAGADAVAEQPSFAGHIEGSGGRAHGENQRTALVLGIAYADRLVLVAEIESVDVAWV